MSANIFALIDEADFEGVKTLLAANSRAVNDTKVVRRKEISVLDYLEQKITARQTSLEKFQKNPIENAAGIRSCHSSLIQLNKIRTEVEGTLAKLSSPASTAPTSPDSSNSDSDELELLRQVEQDLAMNIFRTGQLLKEKRDVEYDFNMKCRSIHLQTAEEVDTIAAKAAGMTL